MRRLIGVLLIAACSGHGNHATDATPGDDTPAVDATPDATPDAAGCGTLAAMPSDVYVDSNSAMDSIGTAACPFHTVLEATALAAPDAAHARTIHVIGANPVRTYTEAGLIALTANLTLAGDGADRVTLAGGGRCVFAATTCTVSLAGGAALRGVTVTSALGDAIEVTGGTGTATIDHATVAPAHEIGILIRGTTTTLDTVSVHDCTQDGLNAKTATVTIANSEFSANHGDGIEIDQAATLTLTGGTITGNFDSGVYLHNGTSFTALAHTITNARIVQNLGYGIDVSSNASLTLRGSTLAGNEIGVYLLFGQNKLDIGTAASPGNNVLGGVGAGSTNVRAGLCMENSPATAVQVVEGDTWRACPPPVKKVAGAFCRSNNTYADIAYVPAAATSGSPVVVPTTCTVGP